MGDMALAEGRFLAAKKALSAHETVKAGAHAAIGYCFGGSVVLAMARAGVDLDLVASFHGGLALPERTADTITPEVLVFHGGSDPFVKPEDVQTFVTDTMSAGAKLTFISYPGVKHSFTNPGASELGEEFDLPLVYDEAADEASWAELGEHLKAAFR
jgi:dienelactone hydrolase